MARIVAPKNLCAFLDTIALSELGEEILADPAADDGYKIIVGSLPGHLVTFDSYADHPRRLMHFARPGLKPSTAAGRYQLLAHYFDDYKALLHLPDFSPESQDLIAVQQIKEAHALAPIAAGDLATAVALCTHLWASFPGNNYGQHQNKMAALKTDYCAAGGVCADGSTA
jgi:muramidase (phage lysozyme)